MGSNDFYPEERPAHRVAVDGFRMDEHPVTNAAFRTFVGNTGYVTVAERPPDPAGYPGVDPMGLVPGSLVFRRPPRRVPLRDFRAWWAYVPGACWRHPEGPESTLAGRERHPVVRLPGAARRRRDPGRPARAGRGQRAPGGGGESSGQS
jgi:formylglycine-generating enzyme